MSSTVRQARASMVRVGFCVPTLGMDPQPARYRLGWSQVRCQVFTTESARALPMTCVPHM